MIKNQTRLLTNTDNEYTSARLSYSKHLTRAPQLGLASKEFYTLLPKIAPDQKSNIRFPSTQNKNPIQIKHGNIVFEYKAKIDFEKLNDKKLIYLKKQIIITIKMHYDSKHSNAKLYSGYKSDDSKHSKAQLYSGYKSDDSKHSKARQNSNESNQTKFLQNHEIRCVYKINMSVYYRNIPIYNYKK